MTRAAAQVSLPADDAPLRLKDAAAIAFPQGGMTVSGLRRERDKGRLVIERIAGKEYTTLAAIAEMRKLCRAQQKDQGCGSSPPGATSKGRSLSRLSGASETGRASEAQASVIAKLEALRRKPSRPSQNISTVGQRRERATVTRLKL
jgi:hypothetical protein